MRYQLQILKGKMLSMLLPAPKALIKNEEKTEIYHPYNVYPLAAGGLCKRMAGKRPVAGSLDSAGSYCPVSIGTCDQCNLVNRYSCLRDEAQGITEKFACFPYAIMYSLLTLLSKQVDKYMQLANLSSKNM